MRNSKRVAPWPPLARAFERGLFPQSLLVVGPDSMTAEVALAIGQQSLCEAAGEAPCECRSCRNGWPTHPDAVVIEPAPRRISREAVTQIMAKIAARPLWSARTVVWLRQADTLTPEAQSHLLKVLEEPPAYVQFLLTTALPDQLLATIRSRCQWFRCQDVAVVATATPLSAATWHDRETPLGETLVAATYWARSQYLSDAKPRWLNLWESLWAAYTALEHNANVDITREVVREAWLRAIS